MLLSLILSLLLFDSCFLVVWVFLDMILQVMETLGFTSDIPNLHDILSYMLDQPATRTIPTLLDYFFSKIVMHEASSVRFTGSLQLLLFLLLHRLGVAEEEVLVEEEATLGLEEVEVVHPQVVARQVLSPVDCAALQLSLASILVSIPRMLLVEDTVVGVRPLLLAQAQVLRLPLLFFRLRMVLLFLMV